jgi:DNA replication protein DnaC
MIHHTPIGCYTKYGLDDFPVEVRDLFTTLVKFPNSWYERGKAVLIWGPEGTGKSCIMGAVHKGLADQRRLVHWVDCADWPDDYEESDDMKDQLSSRSCRIVIWDDLGKEPKNTRGDVRDTIFARHRMPHRVDLITTNLNLSPDRDTCELTQLYGASLRSRLIGMCGEYIIKYEGADRRVEDR